MIDPLWNFSDQVSEKLSIENHGYSFKINLVLHTVGMIERILLNEPLNVESDELDKSDGRSIVFVYPTIVIPVGKDHQICNTFI